MLEEITPLVLTYNEEPNIGRTLERLAWAHDVVVIDSGSTDATIEIARSFPCVRVVHRSFDTFAGQCNFGLGQIASSWVLSLDADYLLSDELVRELASLDPDEGAAGYRAAFHYCIGGRPLRATLYPPRTVLYGRDRAQYRDEGHSHRVEIDGPVGTLQGVIYHDDRKPMRRWLAEQRRYMVAESTHLLRTPASELRIQDRLRCWIVVAPPLVFIYTLFVKGLVFDGWRGWLYVGQRTLAELLLSWRLVAARIRGAE